MTLPAGDGGGRQLSVVGTGLRVGHVTRETEARIRAADRLLYLVADPVTECWLTDVGEGAESLFRFYVPGEKRAKAYEGMVERVLEVAATCRRTCVAFYGHPGVHCRPGHELVRRAPAAGIGVEMLPGVSALDCLFADLGVDPGPRGVQSYDATDFVLRRPAVDPRAPLVLWQAGALGRSDFAEVLEPVAQMFDDLIEVLAGCFGRGTPAVVYEASPLAVARPRVRRGLVGDLDATQFEAMSTLIVLPG